MAAGHTRFHWPTAASVFAGILGAGAVDVLIVLCRASGAHVLDLVALSLGLFGCLGLLAAAVAGWAMATLLGALPGGWRGLIDDAQADARAAGVLFGFAGAACVIALGAAAGHGVFVGQMASRKLAVIASGGLVLLASPLAGLAGLFVGPPLGRLMARLAPRPRRLGHTGTLLLLFATLGLLGFVVALSRADWRVLDLGPMWALAIAVPLAVGHGWFWHISSRGQLLLARLPRRTLRLAATGLVLVVMFVGSRVPEQSPTYAAINDASLGLRFLLKVARGAADRDGDGYAARFGGGDCDDTRADVYPGAEDTPGDGIDQDCQGGDAKPLAVQKVQAALPATPTRANAFQGNILIIAIDALRGDRLGVAGYGRPEGRSLTPTLDALAKRGAYFRRVWSQAPNTPRSFPSLVTSRPPSEIAWQKRSLNYSPILPTYPTFFQPLAAAGLHPIGIFSHFYFTKDRGISTGFAEWSDDGAKSIADSNKDIAAPRIVPQVIARLRKAAQTGERFVLWTHLFEPHSSYVEHPEFPTTLSGVQGLEEKYDYEIAFDDLWVAKIMATLEETGLARNTTVVVFGDHGEAWGEHKVYFHGQDLTEEQLRVPLIITVPGQKPVVVDDEVALLDMGPTLVDLVGAMPPPSFRGRSLLPAIEGKPLSPRPIFAELLPATAWPRHEVMVVSGGKKLTHKITDRRFELHDLATDPKQHKNLAEDPAYRKTLEELRTLLLAFEEHQQQ
jgi:hypothetical protein